MSAPPRTWTRRDWIKAGVIAGTAAGAGVVVGSEVIAPLLAPSAPTNGTIREDFVYTKFSTPQWWDDRAGQPAQPGTSKCGKGPRRSGRGWSGTERTSEPRGSRASPSRSSG